MVLGTLTAEVTLGRLADFPRIKALGMAKPGTKRL